MEDVHDDFLNIARELIQKASIGQVLSPYEIALCLQRQYREGFKAGQEKENRAWHDYQRQN